MEDFEEEGMTKEERKAEEKWTEEDRKAEERRAEARRQTAAWEAKYNPGGIRGEKIASLRLPIGRVRYRSPDPA